jgi:translocator protein
MASHDYVALAVSLLICFAVAAISSIYTLPSVREWYPRIAKPSWRPPNALFGPVWTVLYAAMAFAAWLIWLKRGTHPGVHAALFAYAVQLALNAAWSFIFFGAHRIAMALVDIVLLWLAIVAAIFLFWPISRVAAWLLVPYLSWVSFATVLNAAIWRLNRPAAQP